MVDYDILRYSVRGRKWNGDTEDGSGGRTGWQNSKVGERQKSHVKFRVRRLSDVQETKKTICQPLNRMHHLLVEHVPSSLALAFLCIFISLSCF